jgi:hypothetical protein
MSKEKIPTAWDLLLTSRNSHTLVSALRDIIQEERRITNQTAEGILKQSKAYTDIRVEGQRNFTLDQIDGHEKNCLLVHCPTPAPRQEITKESIIKEVRLKHCDCCSRDKSPDEFPSSDSGSRSWCSKCLKKAEEERLKKERITQLKKELAKLEAE